MNIYRDSVWMVSIVVVMLKVKFKFIFFQDKHVLIIGCHSNIFFSTTENKLTIEIKPRL